MGPFTLRFAPRALRRLFLFVAPLLAAFAAAAPAQAAMEYRGVQLHSLWSGVSYADLDRELDLSRDAGANAVRADVSWSSLQTNGPQSYSQWYVDKLDHFVAGATARGMKVVATLHTTPCWASVAPETLKQSCTGAWWDRGVTKYMPANPLDYARAAQWITSRYGTKLAALEVWNEPNQEDDNFFVNADKPAAYAALVKATYPLAKAGNSEVPVLAGAMSFADRSFLDALYAQGIKGSYDGISVHPYNEWRAPGDLWQDQWKKYTLIPGLRWIREAQTAVGDATPVWVTEFGWTSCTVGADRWCVTEDQQARFVRDSFPNLDSLDFVRAGLVYNLRDKGTDPADTEANFGLVRRDYTPKPAYAGLKEALTGIPADIGPSDGGSTGPPSGGSTAAPPSAAPTPAPATPSAAAPVSSGSAPTSARTSTTVVRKRAAAPKARPAPAPCSTRARYAAKRGRAHRAAKRRVVPACAKKRGRSANRAPTPKRS